MSIRIHQLSKKIGMDNKELLALLRDRGYSVTSASSTVDNISAESLIEEFGDKGGSDADAATEPTEEENAHAELESPVTESTEQSVAPLAPATPPVAAPAPVPVPVAAPAAPPTPPPMAPPPRAAAPAGPAPLSPPRVAPPSGSPIAGSASAGSGTASLPSGVFVKSLGQIEQERKDREAAKAAARVVSSPPPVSGPRSQPPPARPVGGGLSAPGASAPRSFAPPAPSSRPANPVPPPSAGAAPSVPAPRTGPSSLPPPNRAPAAPFVKSPPPPGAPATPAVPMPAAANAGAAAAPGDDVRVIQIKPPIVVRDFAVLLGLKPFKLISELMEMGIFASLNQSIEESVASQIAVKHGFLLDIKHRGDQQAPKKEVKAPEPKVDESKFLEPRPPVVCIMGHVDHGKTSLLDKIRSTNVVAGEAGGITQHIGAYQVALNDRKITFLDTPGHSAFNKMRERGANVTDVAILVVAADDGFMPQTDEALKFIRAAKVTPIVAINKIDAKGADIDRVKRQMQERDLMPEDWGGETITVLVSALKGQGIENLLEMILLQADVLELKANPKAPATGVVIEAEIEVGRGPTATVLIENGTLRVGDALVCGQFFTKVRAMFDDKGKPVKSAMPAEAVRVIGWSGTPECGAIVETVKNDREAKRITEERAFELKKQAAAAAAPAAKPASIENLFQAIAAQKARVLRLVVKADVYGSVEAVVSSLTAIRSDKVSLEIVGADVGPISKNDVLMASASGASIIGFNVKSESGVEALAKHHGVGVSQYEIIYQLVDSVRDTMADMLEPEIREIKIGGAEVRAVFPIAKGFVAGCLVTEGRVQALAFARLRRGNRVEVETRIATIRRVKDEVKEVRAGTECGIHLENYDAYQPGDVIECFEIQKLRATL
ncbi:hypothetical protein ASA1KI_24880 [Opitutales bacterium ASA1]|nr:hypothetical protein ASA1KI_24880 [Opitutales bacterium ASA1]